MFIDRYYHTLRYLRPIQLLGRIWFRLYCPKLKADSVAPPLRDLEEIWVSTACRLPSMIGEDCLLLLGETRRLSEIGWHGNQCSKLYRYNQHYFDDLNAFDASSRREWHLSLLQRWVDENPPTLGDGWEPYPTSLRIVNWVKWAFSGNQLPTSCIESLFIQGQWLSKRLEYHLLGNHLFSNAKALVFIGSFFRGKMAANWLVKGLKILRDQIPEQILKDGGHFELSTMYHALALEDMLDLVNLLRRFPDKPEDLPGHLNSLVGITLRDIECRIPSMLKWLKLMCHPDGEIAFFNDAAFDVAPSCKELFEYAKRLGFHDSTRVDNMVTAQKDSGYIRLEQSGICAFFDTARVGPNYLPGHAHADTLAIEISLFGERVFVNSGISEYGVTKERLRQRSTGAHNTVEINGASSSEVWSGFRVARRAFPFKVNFECHDGSLVASAWHDGYKRLPSPVYVGRKLTLSSGSMVIADFIQGQFKSAVSRLHCHPDVKVVSLSANVVELGLKGGSSAWLTAPEGGTLDVYSTTWHPRFGLSVPTSCIAIRLTAKESFTKLTWS